MILPGTNNTVPTSLEAVLLLRALFHYDKATPARYAFNIKREINISRFSQLSLIKYILSN